MPQYRIFRLEDGHIRHASIIVECATDAEAILEAKQYVDGVDVELWDGPRRVWVSPPSDKE